MSIKTLRKRIALVAVSALGVGLLSVAPASAAVSSITPAIVDWTAATSAGICRANTNDTDNTANDTNDADENLAQAVGEVLVGGTLGFTIATAAQLTAAQDSMSISIVGPAAISGYTPESSASVTANVSFGAGMKSMTVTAPDTTKIELPTAMVLSVTGAGAIQVTVTRTPAAGATTTVERYTFTASAKCITGSADVTNSVIQVMEQGTTVTGISSNITATETRTLNGAGTLVTNRASSADRIANGGTAYIGVRILDGQTTAQDVTTAGVFSASATNGAVVGWSSAALALESSSATDSGTAGSAQAKTLYIVQGTANKDKPLSTVVSIFFNGVLFGTRNITFTGKPTAIKITEDSGVGKTSTANKYVLSYEIVDAAGNLLTSTGPGTDGVASFATDSSENNPLLVTSGTIVDPTQNVVTAIGTINAESTGYAGTVNITCGPTSGSAKVYLSYRFSDLTTIKSPEYDVNCAGGPVNYKASLDKASYAPGEIATLTITATDSKGRAVYDYDGDGAGNPLGSTSKPVSITLPQMTAVTAATNVDEFVGGKKTYKFTVGSTEGTFTGVVDLPLYNSTTYAQAAQTISYKVAAPATGAVTNAEVLAAIVKLIASINKQIRALQKSLRR